MLEKCPKISGIRQAGVYVRVCVSVWEKICWSTYIVPAAKMRRAQCDKRNRTDIETGMEQSQLTPLIN